MPIDYKRYPPHWKELRKHVLSRANNCCEFCNVPNGAVVIRGMWKGVDAYQLTEGTEDGLIYSAEDGEVIGESYVGDIVVKEKGCMPRIVLTVAHLDHDADNHDVAIDRLRALCQRCHIRLDAPVKAAKIKARNDLNKSMGLFGEK